MKNGPFKLRSGNKPSMAQLSRVSPVKQDGFKKHKFSRPLLGPRTNKTIQNFFDKYGPTIGANTTTKTTKDPVSGGYTTTTTKSSFGKTPKVKSEFSFTDPRKKTDKGRHSEYNKKMRTMDFHRTNRRGKK